MIHMNNEIKKLETEISTLKKRLMYLKSLNILDKPTIKDFKFVVNKRMRTTKTYGTLPYYYYMMELRKYNDSGYRVRMLVTKNHYENIKNSAVQEELFKIYKEYFIEKLKKRTKLDKVE